MKPAIRNVIACAGVMAAVGVTFARAGSIEKIGFDFWNLPALEDEVEQEKVLSHDLDSRSEALNRRLDVKLELSEGLIEGRLTFAQIAEEFARMNLGIPSVMMAIREEYPGRSDREAIARNVLQFIGNVSRNRPDRAAIVVRCRAECERYLAEPAYGPSPVTGV